MGCAAAARGAAARAARARAAGARAPRAGGAAAARRRGAVRVRAVAEEGDDDDVDFGECGEECGGAQVNGFTYNDDGPEIAESDDGFNYAFAAGTRDAVSRVLTARSVQLVLMQLEELDVHVCHWLSTYCAECDPGAGPSAGDAFVKGLMSQPDSVVHDVVNDKDHTIRPSELASRVLTTRAHLAAGLEGIDTYLRGRNTELLREHLVQSTMGAGKQPDARRQRSDNGH